MNKTNNEFHPDLSRSQNRIRLGIDLSGICTMFNILIEHFTDEGGMRYGKKA